MLFFHRKSSSLQTARLQLRPWLKGDFADFYRMASDPEVCLPAGSRPVSGTTDGQNAFQRLLNDKDCFAIVLKASGRVIGKIRLQSDAHRMNNSGSLSLGYQLSREYWGQGLMPEALWAMTCYAFEERQIKVLGVSCFSTNARSRRVIEKCGFRYEGMIRLGYRRFDGALFDDLCFSMTREEYLARKAEAR